MDLQLRGKRALVTAASQGLGFGAARVLAEEGCDVHICARNPETLSSAKAELETTGSEITASAIDLVDIASLQEWCENALKDQDIDLLVLSTGHPPTMSFSQSSMDTWRQAHALLLDPVIYLCKQLIPAMSKRGFGRVIIVGSIFGVEHEESSVLQSTYRRATQALCKCLAREYGSDGVTVNTISPGYFDTPLVSRHAELLATQADKSADQLLEEWRSISPIGRLGTPEEFGSLVAYLCSHSAAFLNGSNIVLDGGTCRSM